MTTIQTVLELSLSDHLTCILIQFFPLVITITRFLNLIGCQRVYLSIVFTARLSYKKCKMNLVHCCRTVALDWVPSQLNHSRDKNKNFPRTWVVSLAIAFELLESTFISVDFGVSLYIMNHFVCLALQYFSSSRGMNKY